MTVERYKMYREAGRELNSKITHSCLTHDSTGESAKLLGIVKGNTLIFDSEDEANILMDFALNDYRVNNKSAVQVYREEVPCNEIELDILDALLSSYTSLFKLTSASKAESLLVLDDLLNKKENVKLMDVGFSRTATPGLLLFTRLISFTDFNMTSGVSFVFRSDLEEYLLRKYKRLSKRVKSDSESIKRFVSFFRLNRTDGLEIKYE